MISKPHTVFPKRFRRSLYEEDREECFCVLSRESYVSRSQKSSSCKRSFVKFSHVRVRTERVSCVFQIDCLTRNFAYSRDLSDFRPRFVRFLIHFLMLSCHPPWWHSEETMTELLAELLAARHKVVMMLVCLQKRYFAVACPVKNELIYYSDFWRESNNLIDWIV